jgi:hypothetical protein
VPAATPPPPSLLPRLALREMVLPLSSTTRFGQSGPLTGNQLYVKRSPAVGTKVFVSGNQNVNGWEDIAQPVPYNLFRKAASGPSSSSARAAWWA